MFLKNAAVILCFFWNMKFFNVLAALVFFDSEFESGAATITGVWVATGVLACGVGVRVRAAACAPRACGSAGGESDQLAGGGGGGNSDQLAGGGRGVPVAAWAVRGDPRGATTGSFAFFSHNPVLLLRLVPFGHLF